MSKLLPPLQLRLTPEQDAHLRKLPGSISEALRALIDRAIVVPCPACKGSGLQTAKGPK